MNTNVTRAVDLLIQLFPEPSWGIARYLSLRLSVCESIGIVAKHRGQDSPEGAPVTSVIR